MIKLDENYSITSDAYNWILKFEEVKEGKDKDGNPKEVISTRDWYHATLKQTLLTYIDESSKDIPELNLILQKLDELEVKIDNLNVSKDDAEDNLQQI